MHNLDSCMILSLVAFSLTCFLPLQATLAAESLTTTPKSGNETGVGVILDQTSRPGKEAKVAIELAVQDFKIKVDQPLVLYLKNSRNKHVQVVIAAKELVDEHKVKVILGGHTWEEASTIAEVISDSEPDHDIPVFLSFAGTIPLQSTNQWPFLIQAVPTQSTQMNAVAAILQSMGIHQVTLIYESASIISHLTQAFRETGSELTHIIPITSSSCSLVEELEVVKRQQRKVFVVHTSLEVGVCLFQTAKKMEMIGDGYLWIATNAITDLFHSVNSTVFSSLKGMVGVKSYFPESTPEFLNFRKTFRKKFHSDYPEDEQDEPGIFAVQGYNAMKMLEEASPEKFNEMKTVLANTVEIVNVNGKGYHSVYWTEGLGFSETVENEINGASNYTHLIDNVGEIMWPVQPWYASGRRRNVAGSSQNRLRVGVPANSLFKQFVFHDNETRRFSGFVVDVFHEMMTKMNQPYDLIPFNDSYNDLVKAIYNEEFDADLIKEIHLQRFDAVAGDVTITSERQAHAYLTQPFTESGLEMIVPAQSRLSNQPWLFLKPFTGSMWCITAVIVKGLGMN